MPKLNMRKALKIFLLIIIGSTRTSSQEVDITKCCPEAGEVFDLYSKSCQTLDADYLEDLDTFHIEANLGYDTNVHVSEVDLPVCNDSIYQEKHTIVLADNDVDSSSGFFTHYENGNSSQLILYDLSSGQDTKDFCLDRAYDLGPYSTSISFKGTVAVQCRTTAEGICLNTTCIHQCCPLYHFQNVNGLCELNRGLGSNLEWILQNTQEDVDASLYHPLYDSLKCDKITYNLSLYQWEFYKNGDLKIESSLYQAKDYCLNDIEEWDDESGTFQYWHDVHVCVHAEGDCKGEYKAWDCVVNRQILPAIFCLSMVFFGLLALHLWLTKKEKLFECMMISNIGMLFIVYFVLFIDKISGSFLSPHPVLCEIRGLIIQFGFISSLFWLNSMSHLMWKTFRKIRRVNDKSQKYGFQDAKYKKYALYSWGCPLIVTVVTITMQHLPNELVPEWLTTPDIGTEKCFLRSTGEGLDLPQLWYFHVINAPLLLMNMVFFLLFLYNMCCGVWSQKAGEPGNARTQRKLKAVCKVFFVMGLTWIAEIISYSLKVSYGHHVYVSQFTFPLQLLNALQGVIMFCVIYFTRDQVKNLKKGQWWSNKTKSTTTDRQPTTMRLSERKSNAATTG